MSKFGKYRKMQESPWADGFIPKKPTDALHAVALIRGCEDAIERNYENLAKLNTEACEAYDGCCEAYLQAEYEQCEAYKKQFHEIELKRLRHIDWISGNLAQIRVCKAYLASHPLPATKEGELCDDKGKTANPDGGRLRQGRLF